MTSSTKTELIGREHEIAAAFDRLHTRRLVTITGAGGVGKTALAQHIADRYRTTFDTPVVFIDLTRIDDGRAVPELVAGKLGLTDLDALMYSSADQPMLVVLDNCEHVIAQAADAVSKLLERLPATSILATSRSALELAGESLLPLRPLALLPAGGTGQSDSFTLFAARAEDHDVVLRIGDQARAAEVCRIVGGLPLALEIAAAQLKTRTLAELVANLTTRPHELERPRFRGDHRHRSIVETVQWSSALLAPESAKFFVELAVFAGPFTAAMACSLAETSHEWALTELDRLVAASLLTTDTSTECTWYTMLPSIRAVALEDLRASGRLPCIESRWVGLIIDAVLEIVADSARGFRPEHLQALLSGYDDLAAALRWTLANDHDRADRTLLLVAVLWGVVHQRHTREVAALGQSALDKWPDPTAKLWPEAAATVATCQNLLGDHQVAIDLASLALAECSRADYAYAPLQRVVAHAYRALGHLDDARLLLADASDAAFDGGHVGLAMELRVDQGFLVGRLGDPVHGLALIDEVRATAVAQGALVNGAWALACRSLLMIDQEPHLAGAVIAEALTEARTVQYPSVISVTLRARALCGLSLGRHVAAATSVLELLDELARCAGLDDLRMALDTGAAVCERCGDPGWADLVVTAQGLAVTSVSVSAEDASYERALEAGGRELGRKEAFDYCRAAMLAAINNLEPHPAEPVLPMAARSDEAAMRLEGDTWRIRFADHEHSFRATKGLADLAQLLGRPGVEVAALDLAGAYVQPSGTSPELVIDSRARCEYQARIRDLQADIATAEDHNDIGRAETLNVELETLLEHLSSVLGLGGRTRSVTTDSERARSAVTHRIRTAIKKVGGLNPALGAHLQASVTTGSICCYRPPIVTTWTVS